MKRPLIIFAVSIASGIYVSYIAKSGLPVILAIILVLFLSIKSIFKIKLNSIIIISLILFVVGSIEFCCIDSATTSKYKNVSSGIEVVYGYIDSEPEISENKICYTINSDRITHNGKFYSIMGRILLTVYRDENTEPLDYGREIEIIGTLVIPGERRNPGGYDYRQSLAKKGVSASIYVSAGSITEGNITKRNELIFAGIKIKNEIIRIINQSMPKEQAGLLNGMLIGVRNGLDDDVQNSFSDAGLTHIMAVSGMNVAFIIFPLAFILKKIHIKRIPANLMIISVLILFVFITGFSPSVLRAAIMASTVLIGGMIMRDNDVFSCISLSAIILLVYNPYLLFDIGFQLSYMATLSIILFYKQINSILKLRKLPGFISDVLSVTIAAQLGVVPLIAFYFNKISVISIASNVFVVPIVQVVTILGFCMAILGKLTIHISQFLGCINYIFLSFILTVAKISAKIPFAVMKTTTPNIVMILIYYCFLLLIYFRKYLHIIKLKFKYCVIALILMSTIIFIAGLIPKGLEVIFIDVGEGDSTLVRTNSNKVILIDGGGVFGTGKTSKNAGDLIIMPLLADYNISKIDMVIATHSHIDHIGGLIPILEKFRVGSLILPNSDQENKFSLINKIASEKNIRIVKCGKSNEIKVDNETYFKVIYPEADYLPQSSPLNNGSLVLKLIYKKIAVLFVGDIEKEAEDLLIRQSSDIKTDVLKIAHHGSANSSSNDFLNLVKPKAAVISVGKNNFGHPSKEVLSRLKNNSITILRTDLNGAIILNSDGESIKIKKFIED